MSNDQPCVKPYKTTYDWGTSYWMARLSQEVYTKEQESQKPNESQILASL